ncbi:toprim domain-containing protein, partial [Candidatus Parcubacteria bacterium]
MKLVIVESPTKAKTISKFLGKGFSVESSYGHLRDLPKSRLGIDVEKDFEPHYIVPKKVQSRATALKKTASKAKEVIIATDEDREGEAIAWHITKILGAKDPEQLRRIVFH